MGKHTAEFPIDDLKLDVGPFPLEQEGEARIACSFVYDRGVPPTLTDPGMPPNVELLTVYTMDPVIMTCEGAYFMIEAGQFIHTMMSTGNLRKLEERLSESPFLYELR